ncbi:MAG: hypothetical protein FWG46_05090, partial [Treponema sp.]|nr:hypothetical protein [Treponema sp.]
MKKNIICIFIIFFSGNLTAQEKENYFNYHSASLDPLTIIGLFAGIFLSDADDGVIDFRNMWICGESNWITSKQLEFGAGVFLRDDRAALTAKYRSFRNKETQSGFFWGLFGLIEWRRMYWLYGGNSEPSVAWTFPFRGNNNVF